MLNYENFAVTLGRALNVFRSAPEDIVQQKGALRALVALSSLGAVALRAEDGEMRIGGKPIPLTLPFVPALLACLEGNRVRRLNISRSAAAADLLKMVRSLAADDRSVIEDEYDTIAIEVLVLVSERLTMGHRPESVSRAFDRAEIARAIAATEDGEKTVEIEPPDPEDVWGTGNKDEADAQVALEDEETVEIETVSPPDGSEATAELASPVPERESRNRDTSELSLAMLRLAGASMEDDVEDLVFEVGNEVEKELEEGKDQSALEGIASLVNLESQVQQAEKGIYTQALLRLLVPEILVRVARLTSESKHTRYAVAVLHRAGAAGTTALIEQIVKAPSVETMDAYGAALPAVKDGVEKLVEGLNSDDTTMISVAIDQLSKLDIAEISERLADLAIEHPQRAIRQSACRGLLRLTSTDSVTEQIQRVLESQAAVHMGRCVMEGASDQIVGLIARVAVGTNDVVAQKELCRALGRVASTPAVQQLIRMSLPGGRFFGRKPIDSRLAAIEGLGLVHTTIARGTLEELSTDRNADIRGAALKMLEKTDPPLE